MSAWAQPCQPQWNNAIGQPGAGGGIGTTVYALAAFDDGSGPALFAGGNFTGIGGIQAKGIAKWNGTTWSPLGLGVSSQQNATVRALSVFDDGTGIALFAGGDFSQAGSVAANNIARWKSGTWASLGAPGGGVGGTVRALAPMGMHLYVGGTYQTAGQQFIANLARWDGTNWSGVIPGISGSVHALCTFDDGEIVPSLVESRG